MHNATAANPMHVAKVIVSEISLQTPLTTEQSQRQLENVFSRAQASANASIKQQTRLLRKKFQFMINDPDLPQNLMSSSLAQTPSFHEVRCKLVQ